MDVCANLEHHGVCVCYRLQHTEGCRVSSSESPQCEQVLESTHTLSEHTKHLLGVRIGGIEPCPTLMSRIVLKFRVLIRKKVACFVEEDQFGVGCVLVSLA